LRRSTLGRHDLARLEVSGLQKPLDQQQKARVFDADSQTFINPVRSPYQSTFDVGIDQVVDGLSA
jgi:hypothetical protein